MTSYSQETAALAAARDRCAHGGCDHPRHEHGCLACEHEFGDCNHAFVPPRQAPREDGGDLLAAFSFEFDAWLLWRDKQRYRPNMREAGEAMWIKSSERTEAEIRGLRAAHEAAGCCKREEACRHE